MFCAMAAPLILSNFKNHHWGLKVLGLSLMVDQHVSEMKAPGFHMPMTHGAAFYCVLTMQITFSE